VRNELNRQFFYYNSLVPNFSWAQRNDKFWIKLELVHVQYPEVVLLPEGKLFFKGSTKENVHYKLELEFFGPINVSQSKWEVNDWNILFTIQKKESGPYWPRLLKSEEKLPNMKIDWTRYQPDPTELQDEDEIDTDTQNDKQLLFSEFFRGESCIIFLESKISF
jgi:prostaglandin-E synthase